MALELEFSVKNRQQLARPTRSHKIVHLLLRVGKFIEALCIDHNAASESNPLALLIERSDSSPGFRITQLTSGHSPIWEQPARDVFTFVPCGDKIRFLPPKL